jgi:mannose-6-phosphate isomerase-like protein (cupin superfamily)
MLMQAFNWSKLLEEREQTGRPWLEFLRVPSLSMGIYHLKAGQTDAQQPHTEEVYYVVSGRGRFRSGQEDQPVKPGSLIFVRRLVEHRFFDVTEDLTMLVFFAPAEGSTAPERGP